MAAGKQLKNIFERKMSIVFHGLDNSSGVSKKFGVSKEDT